MSIYSTYWYRVADSKPQIRSHAKLCRHRYRGQDWYVLQDPSSNRQHRFNKGAYGIITRLDGLRTVQEIWDQVQDAMGDDAPTQDEVIRLLGQLHSSDVLQSDMAADSMELFERQEKQRGKWKQRFLNPFAVRFPLFDPDRYLSKLLFLAKPFVGRLAFMCWLFVVGTACFLAVLNWTELTHNMADQVLSPENLLLLWLVYPCVKLLHELGHAFAVRVWGGEVHEMGVMILAMTPLPYVEASASAAFPDKRKRIGVAAAGMMVEMFLASLALLLWLNIESGQVSAILYNVILIGGFSTLVFNGNPLLRFDGYYVLSDVIEIPSLASRSKRYLGYLFKQYLLGIESSSPVTAPGEKGWFVFYGIASFCYRIFIIAALTLFISGKFFIVGILIALWALATQIVFPFITNISELWNSMGGRRKHSRILVFGSVLLGIVVLSVFVVPVPLRTQVEGVVSLPESSRVQVGTDCFVSEILTANGSIVEKGQPLIRCEDHLLETEIEVLVASLEEAELRYDAEPLRSRVKRKMLKGEINTVKAEIDRGRQRVKELTVYSPNQGELVLPEVDTLVGRYVKQGGLFGYIIGASGLKAVLVVEQSDVSLVRDKTKSVELRLAGRVAEIVKTSIEREVPAASSQLPSAILGTNGGGSIPVDPADVEGTQALRKIFQFEVGVPVDKDEVRIGERVYARFDHGFEPIGFQWFRVLRKLFLRQFHV
ncbi:MAG: putative peptide zinc metalloprotease protein [Desulforhopalus sp.]|jgi:putative peptide zinc metalloprotease protein